MNVAAETVFESRGYCPVCEGPAIFRATSDKPIPPNFQAHWFRGALRCEACRSGPRSRAISHVLNRSRPNWRTLAIHESSPGGPGLSPKLRRQCPGYIVSQYNPDLAPGEVSSEGWRNEDLEAQTFDDEEFDIVLTQDVFEHLFNPGRAAAEITRTLRPGGLYIMTVPIMHPFGSTVRRASLLPNGEVQHHLEAAYHGNPVGDGRALVTVDWSYDIGPYLSAASGIPFTVLVLDDMGMGIRDPYNAVVVAHKSPPADLGENLPGRTQ